MNFVKRWFLLCLMALAPCAACAAPNANSPKVQHQKDSFFSHGKTIRVDIFEPVSIAGDPGRALPGAIVLNGAGGTLFDGPDMRRVANELAGVGVRAFVVHYFDGSGVAFTTRDSVLRAHHDEWLAVIRDAVHFAQLHSKAPQEPVGIYGYSMGAYLGVEASADNPGVSALAEQSGGVWDNEVNRLGRRMPPVLMIHGRQDRRVPFEKYAVPLERALRQRGTKVETRIYDQEGHRFSREAAASARVAAARFLAAKLATGNPAAKQSKPVRRSRPETIQR